jgi:hypothetical protein
MSRAEQRGALSANLVLAVAVNSLRPLLKADNQQQSHNSIYLSIDKKTSEELSPMFPIPKSRHFLSVIIGTTPVLTRLSQKDDFSSPAGRLDQVIATLLKMEVQPKKKYWPSSLTLQRVDKKFLLRPLTVILAGL